ncbi:Sigma 54 interacting domain protein [Pseudodesulfovibrio mercurii]|uniref:Sigma 54 interacting domain protein n=1 Tax=Pseudodesulfovibrio mercurii TaxID=641491 RepID=F0JIC0_9BACT|nr:sigma-54 dependent transcriptional regulator [Pseudodesulfovibrio mercurii]EGB14172.1 Sigma 54 interacting domain protein [Pseudodesulfovibrio mercurii]
MRVYYEPPSSLGKVTNRFKALYQSYLDILLDNSSICEKVKSIYFLFKNIFPVDMIMLALPATLYGEHEYNIFAPDINEEHYTQMISIEQGRVVMNSSPKRIVRIANQDDKFLLCQATKSIIKNKNFSLMYFRNIIFEKFAVTLALVSKKNNAYSDKHVSYFFKFADSYTKFCENKIPSSQKQWQMQDASRLPLDLPGMQHVNELIWKVSRETFPVLILGETGTGKEVVANTIYEGSVRRSAPFIKINCANMPENLIESELFGHERGSYTGATETVKGRFERANNGVLLLDELGEFPILAQAKLLRVLQEGVIERVGGSTEIPVDVRIIAATHRNIVRMCEEGRFRKDLLYRLNIFPIYIPPLRERREDIPILITYFIKKRCSFLGICHPPRVSGSEMKKLCAYSWRGNIRELQNAVERAVLLWGNSPDKPFTITPNNDFFQDICRKLDGFESESDISDLSFETAVKGHILKVLTMTSGKITGANGAAEVLKLNPSTLRAKMRKLGIAQTA